MKLLLFFLLLFSTNAFSQNMSDHQKISQDAYFDYIKKGGIASEWPRYQSQYVEQYKQSNYNPSTGSQYQRKTTNVNGLITNSAGQTIGMYSNGQVLNSYNQPVGYFNGNTLMGQSGVNSGCICSVQGNRIMNCQGGVMYTINGTSITNSNGYNVAFIRGNSIYNTSNQLLATIAGINTNSIAAYLMFFSR